MAISGESVVNGAKSASQQGANAADRIKSEISNTAEEWTSTIKDAGADIARRVESAGGKAYDTAKQRTLDGAEQLEGNIRDYPWVAVGVAFGLGALFGSLCRK